MKFRIHLSGKLPKLVMQASIPKTKKNKAKIKTK